MTWFLKTEGEQEENWSAMEGKASMQKKGFDAGNMRLVEYFEGLSNFDDR